MADNVESHSKGVSKSERADKVPIVGLNPGALVFCPGRHSHVDSHADKSASNHTDKVQDHWLGRYESGGGARPSRMPYTNTPGGFVGTTFDPFTGYDPGFQPPSASEVANKQFLDYMGQIPYPSPYFTPNNGGMPSGFGYVDTMDYVNPADPFAGQLFEVDEARHGGPVGGYRDHRGYAYGETADGYDGADERNGNGKLGGKKKKKAKKAKKFKEGFKGEHAEGVAGGNSQEYGKKHGGIW
ncbi:hypothetical protein NX059_000512 [Plenodomus lindquistii]|nr:hypothetical protein NX059_000512 [Plenodomus lindquistii]